MPTDAEDWDTALTILEEYAEVYSAPTLGVPDEVEPILNRCKRATRWSASTAYTVGQIVIPEERNGYSYIVRQPGTSQSASKDYTDWPTSNGERFSEGTSDPLLVMEVHGSDEPFLANPYDPQNPNVYDLKKAIYEVWALKARKAVQFMDAGDLKFEQVWQHCKQMMETFGGSNGWGQARVIRA